MRKTGIFGRAARIFLGAVGFLSLQACDEENLPSQAIFHPGGAQALHASQIQPASLSVRESVYVPVYSNIHWAGLSAITELSATISIRNADKQRPLVLISATYYDSVGQPIHEYLEGAMELDPLATVEFVVERADRRGGSGANFLVDWGSTEPIAEPVMEAIMLGQIGNAGISFTSPGRAINVVGPAHGTGRPE